MEAKSKKKIVILLGIAAVVVVVAVAAFAAGATPSEPQEASSGPLEASAEQAAAEQGLDEPSGLEKEPYDPDASTYVEWVKNLDDQYLLDNIVLLSGDEAFADQIESMRAQTGRDFTDEEAAALTAGMKAQMVYENARNEGRDLTEEELAVVSRSGELVFGDAREWSETVGQDAEISPQSGGSTYPGGSYSTPIGTYPIQKGVILVTADWFANLLPSGHAAIVHENGNAVTSLAMGVTTEPNDWHLETRHQTCFALDVNATNATQEAIVADWCYGQIGKPYNFNFLNMSTRNSFYCSQLVWAGYYDNYGIDLDTDAFSFILIDDVLSFDAVHPLELVASLETSLLYRHGTALPGWEQISVYRYHIDSNGIPASGWKTIGGSTYYFRTATNTPSSGPQYSMVTGCQLINGTYCYFNAAGIYQYSSSPGDTSDYVTGAATSDAGPALEYLGISGVEESGQ
jgi:uncharacterized protein YycO